jgi:hypothetical protein
MDSPAMGKGLAVSDPDTQAVGRFASQGGGMWPPFHATADCHRFGVRPVSGRPTVLVDVGQRSPAIVTSRVFTKKTRFGRYGRQR